MVPNLSPSSVATLDLATDARAQALAVADNRVAELDLAWDEAPLRDLHAAGVDLSPFWTDAEFAALVAEPLTGRTAENAVVAPGPTDMVRGDLVALGRHRLLCGDATVADEVARVLAGVVPALMVTDPAVRRAVHGRRGVTTRIPSSGPRSARSPTTIAPTGRRRGGCFRATSRMCGTRACTPRPWRRIWKPAGFELRAQVIWVKQHFALSRGHYHWRHEPCWYAVRRGATAQWCGDRRQSTVWEVPNLNPVGSPPGPEDAVTGHGTQKPVRLFEIPIGNHAQPGDAVYDPFVGSGTSIIAAEKTGRVCLALEIDPAYVQAAMSRWEAFTGQSAVRLGGAR